MTKLSGYGAYALFLAITRHFESDFDFFKYGGVVKTSKATFDKSKERFTFEKLANRFEDNELLDYFLGNVIAGVRYIRDASDDHYFEYLIRKEAMTYTIIGEIEAVLDNGAGPNLIEVGLDDLPKLVVAYLGKQISPETFAVLDHYLSVTDRMPDNSVTHIVRTFSHKLFPFLRFDKDKIENFIFNHIVKGG